MNYRSTYLDTDGRTATAVVEAPDEQALHEQMHRQGRTLLRASPVRDGGDAVAVGNPRIPPKKLILFVQSLQGALDAGVPLLATIAAIAEQEDDPQLEAMFRDVAARVSSGTPLSDALARYPRSFPGVFCALVRAGEHSGSLPQVLESMAGFLEWRKEIGGTIKQALIYPAVVLAAGYGLVMFLLSFVIPKLGDILSKIGGELPAASRMLISCSGFVAANVVWLLLATIAALVGLVLAARTDAGRSGFAALFSVLPVARTVVRTLNIAQFCRNMGVLLNAGLTMTASMELAAEAIAARGTREAILDSRDAIVGGAKLTEALDEIDLLPPVAMSMVRVGEEAGKLPGTFERLSRVYDREVKDAVRKALGLLEPIVTVMLGLVVGGVAVLVISTIYSAMKGIGR